MKRSVFLGNSADWDEPSVSKRGRPMKPSVHSEGGNGMEMAHLVGTSQRLPLKVLSSNSIESSHEKERPRSKNGAPITLNPGRGSSGAVSSLQTDSSTL
jgi:hypothetical protein